MKSIIRRIMSHPLLIERPPIFLDIGASGDLPQQWKVLAPFSICLAFDADTRDFVVSELEGSGWKRLYTLNRIVLPKAVGEVDFYLTQSPYCSSSLQPDKKSLESWAFASLFEVEQQVKLQAVDLQVALMEIGIGYVDWYKADTQGTDLRIFAELADHIRDNILVADFEPGIIDAYVGEDKLHHLLSYMDARPFWVSQMEVKGSQRIDGVDVASLNRLQRRGLGSILKSAPGWCEISYLNSLQTTEFTCRDYLLAWVFSSMKGEHGFALHVARLGADRFQEPLFHDLYSISRQIISPGFLKYAGIGARKAVRLLSGRR
jgi:hypothetical protein